MRIRETTVLFSFCYIFFYFTSGRFELPDDFNDKKDTGEKGHAMYGSVNTPFFNDGTLYGWTSRHAEHLGSVVEVATGCFDNGRNSNRRCIKINQTYDENYRRRYHAEVVLENATKLGEQAYFGFAFKISEDWEFDESFAKGGLVAQNRIAITQFIANFRDWDCHGNTKIAVPTTMVWIQNDDLHMRIRSGSVCIEDKEHEANFRIGKLIPGKWNTIVFGVHWHKKNHGWMKVWFNKKLVVDETDIMTTMNIDDRLFQWRVGMYPNWYRYDGRGHPYIRHGLKTTKEIFIDQIGVGPEYSDADPMSETITERVLRTKLTYYTRYIHQMETDEYTDEELKPDYKVVQLLRRDLKNITRKPNIKM